MKKTNNMLAHKDSQRWRTYETTRPLKQSRAEYNGFQQQNNSFYNISFTFNFYS